MAGEIPTKPRKPTILEEIMEMLEANGKVDEKTKYNLLLKAVGEVIKQTECLSDYNERIEILERRNIATAFIKHPYAMSAIVIIAFILLNALAHSFSVVVILAAILKALGIPVPQL